MLSGPALGAAIKAAIEKKQVPKKELAAHFGVKPPSVQDWIKNGTIRKDRFLALVGYFSDVVEPSHWGMDPQEAKAAINLYATSQRAEQKSSEQFSTYAADARQSFSELGQKLNDKQRYALRQAVLALFSGPGASHVLDRDQVLALLADHLYREGLKAEGFSPLSRSLHADTLNGNDLPEERQDGAGDPAGGDKSESEPRPAAGGSKT